MEASYVGILVLQLANVLASYTLWMLQTYLTDVWKLSFTHAAGILNIWKGITMILPVGFIFFVDAFLGHYGMLVLSSSAFCLGLGLLSASTPPVLVCYLGTCKNYEPEYVSAARKALFYTALALIAVGKAGLLVSAKPFLLEQRENNSDVHGKQVQDKQSENNPDVHSVQDKQSENDPDVHPVQGKQSENPPEVHPVHDKQSENNPDVHPVQGKQSENDPDVNAVQGKPSENTPEVHLVQIKQSENDSDVHLVQDRQSEKVQGKQSEKDPDEHPVIKVILMVIMSLIGGIGVPLIKPWSIRFGVPAIYTFVATLVFLCMSCLYKISKPKGSPWTNVCRVFVACALKKGDGGTAESQQQQQITNTRFLRCLEKAALPNKNVEDEENRWRNCTTSEVEEAQIVVRMVPMWMTFVVCGIVSSIGNTYFVEQAENLDGNLGKWKAPPLVLLLVYGLAKTIFAILYTRMKRCFSRRFSKYAPPVGIAMAMVFSILCCITAAKVETQRLNVIRAHSLPDKPEEKIPMSMFWLILPFFLLAGQDAFFEMGVKGFFTTQGPESMRNYLIHSPQGVLGLGFIGSVVSVHVVGEVTREKGPSWFQFTLNRSRLDKYYWVLAALSSANLLVYILIAFRYRYKDPSPCRR